ncbi:hypothetical protein GALMADRAFT_230610 [Galerina marginata CBS 339.88]|uniref:Uncharacterized protein n=1 Tax=Galerina marginata (strain CBS 339.88) TaxID=685588 RepID=A0A067SI28_GALM3|nr:hypothetical protein GALMADRAFT_230610 [Galerina marginata CBS 339.88]
MPSPSPSNSRFLVYQHTFLSSSFSRPIASSSSPFNPLVNELDFEPMSTYVYSQTVHEIQDPKTKTHPQVSPARPCCYSEAVAGAGAGGKPGVPNTPLANAAPNTLSLALPSPLPSPALLLLLISSCRPAPWGVRVHPASPLRALLRTGPKCPCSLLNTPDPLAGRARSRR